MLEVHQVHPGFGARCQRVEHFGDAAAPLVLLAGAGFMMRSFLTMYRMDVGINTSQLLSLNMILPGRKYPSLEDRAMFLRRVEEQLSTAGDILGASTTTSTPFSGGSSRQLELDGRLQPTGRDIVTPPGPPRPR